MQTAEMIGAKVTELRKRVGLSQAQLALQMSVSPQAVGKWERGESMPDIISFDRLATVLGVDLNYFSEGAGQTSGEETAPPAAGSTAAASPTADPAAAATTAETAPTAAPAHNPQAAGPSPQVKEAAGLKWDMSKGSWENSDFSGLKSLGDKFGQSNIQNCRFVGSDLSKLTLKANYMVKNDFSGSNLSESRFVASHVVDCSFRGADLARAEFVSSHLQGCDFSAANLDGALFKSSTLQKCTVENTAWRGVEFSTSQITGCMINSLIEDCSFQNCDLTKIRFVNASFKNTFFKNINLKRTVFEGCQADRLSYAFLQSAKADMANIRLVEAVEEGESDGQ